jgi:hypothetical protein
MGMSKPVPALTITDGQREVLESLVRSQSGAHREVVVCADEKSSVQALDRTQASLPMTKGRGQAMTHDYKRNRTTTLFAALAVLTGMVIGQCLPRHRHQEFLKVLRTIETRSSLSGDSALRLRPRLARSR